MENYKGIMVYIENRNNQIENVSLELLGEANKLAKELDTEVTALIVGKDIKPLAKEVTAYGANNVILVDDSRLEKYMVGPYATSIERVINSYKPEIFLIGATTIGRDVAPRVSAKIKTGLTADCTQLAIDEKTKLLLMTRPAFGGNLMATIICKNHRPQMSTVRPGVMDKLERDDSRTSKVDTFDAKLEDSDFNVEILEETLDTKKQINIEEASKLVSCGRGVGSPEHIKTFEKLASLIGAEVSCSRAVVDNGWLPKDHQVGQTGKTVKPDLYMAMGISGAIQHIAGMESSNYIVAVNKKSSAPIFEVSDLGIVGDMHKIAPELIKLLEQE